MRSTSVRVTNVMSAALLALALLGSNVLAQSVSVSVDSPFSPNPIRVCDQSQASFSATVTGLPPVPYPCTLQGGPTWEWEVNGPSGVWISGSGSSATVYADNVCTSGNFAIEVAAVASWTDTCGNIYYTAPGSVTVNLVVVAVTSITPLAEVQDKNIGDTLTKSDFTITTNPPGYDDLVTVPSVTI